jgi:hypothetical protein
MFPLKKTPLAISHYGKVQAGPDDSDPFIATEDNDVTTKKFVDDKFDFSKYTELS